MTIKRKTQLNLSGSHRTLDADNAFVGGFLFVTGSVTASVGVSASSFQAGGQSTFKSATFDGFVSASGLISTANNLQVGQNAFVTGSLQVTGSIFVAAAGLISASVVSASVGVSASVLQGTTVTAQKVTASYFSGSATQYFGTTAGNLDGTIVVQSPMFLSGTAVSSAFGATGLQFVVGLKDNNYIFGVDSGSISWGSGSGFKIVPSSSAGKVQLWLNGENVGEDNGGGGGGGATDATAITGGLRFDTNDGGLFSGSVSLIRNNDNGPFSFGSSSYWQGNSGVGKFTLNTIAKHIDGGDGSIFGAASFTHVVTFVSSSSSTNPAGKLYPLVITELDYITHSFGGADMSTFDVNIYAVSNDLLIGVTGNLTGSNSTSFACTVTDGFVHINEMVTTFL